MLLPANSRNPWTLPSSAELPTPHSAGSAQSDGLPGGCPALSWPVPTDTAAQGCGHSAKGETAEPPDCGEIRAFRDVCGWEQMCRRSLICLQTDTEASLLSR